MSWIFLIIRPIKKLQFDKKSEKKKKCVANLVDDNERAFLGTEWNPPNLELEKGTLPSQEKCPTGSHTWNFIYSCKPFDSNQNQMKINHVISNSWELLLDCVTVLYYLFMFICYQRSKCEFSKVKHMKMLRTAATLLIITSAFPLQAAWTSYWKHVKRCDGDVHVTAEAKTTVLLHCSSPSFISPITCLASTQSPLPSLYMP